VKQILEGGSSSDEESPANQLPLHALQQYPWLKNDYLNIYDDLKFDSKQFDPVKHNYPNASQTDKKVALVKDTLGSGPIPTSSLNLPGRFLVICHNQKAAENMIRLFESHYDTSRVEGLIFLSQFQSCPEMNRKYGLDSLAKTTALVQNQMSKDKRSPEILLKI